MPLAKIVFKPGIDKEGTQYTTGAGWYDCDKVRFRQGRPEKIGGWIKYSENPIKGIARSLFDWNSSTSDAYFGIGTNLKFYVESGTAYFDITPIRATTAVGGATFAASAGSATLTVSDTSHGASVNDFVIFSGAVSLGGNIIASVLNHEYQVSRVIDGNSYEISATDTNGDPVLATAGDVGNGGASVVAEYQIGVGTNTFVPSTGYSVGTYGGSPWGGGGALSQSGQLRLYSQDVFADDLLFNPRAGGVYYWDESVGTGTRAVALPDMVGANNAPTVAFQVMVSSIDRHVICFGVNPIGGSEIDPLLVRWSDQESAIDWMPTAINSAGGQVLSGGTLIIGAVKTRQEILIFTDTSIHSMRYSGAPYVYRFSVVSENVSVLGPKAMVAVGDAVYFMDIKGFYIYRGSVTRLNCTVFDYVFDNIDRTQLYKVFAHNNTDNSEITWFYPVGIDSSEISHYVTYNYMEDLWYIGTLARGAWIPAHSRSYPIASSIDLVNINDNYIYTHEFGYDADGQEMTSYIESGELSIADGESFSFLRRIIPDFSFTGAEQNVDITVQIKGTDFPLDDPQVLYTSAVTYNTKQLYVRVRAREIALRISSEGTGYGWDMGDFRFDLRTDGRR